MTTGLRALLASLVVVSVSALALGCEATTVVEEKGSASNAMTGGYGNPLEAYAGENGYLRITEGGIVARTSHDANELRAEDSVSAIVLAPEGDAPGPIGEEVGTLTLTETQDWSAMGRGNEERRDARKFIRRANGETVDGVYFPGVYSTGAFTIVPQCVDIKVEWSLPKSTSLAKQSSESITVVAPPAPSGPAAEPCIAPSTPDECRSSPNGGYDIYTCRGTMVIARHCDRGCHVERSRTLTTVSGTAGYCD